MSLSITQPAPPAAKTGRRLDAQTHAFLIWLACWIVLPNLPFLPITLMGGPPRLYHLLACGIVGLLARRLPGWMQMAVFLGLMGYLITGFIAKMFNMGLDMVMSVAPLVFDMSPATSPEYVLGGLMLLVCTGTALWLLRRPPQFERPLYILLGCIVTISLAAADYYASRDTIGSYTRLAPDGAPFSSASQQTDFAALADGHTNMMVVVVEAMGEPVDPAARAALEAMWMRPELASRYEITHGTTPFYGSTTSGEMRELCQRWGNYFEIEGAEPDCLPARLARQGYETSSWHGFMPSFFERDRWYPLLGFQQMHFGEELERAGVHECRNVFPGACDSEIPPLISRQMQQADKPQFVYWLTLNSHLPIIESDRLGTRNCSQLGAQYDSDYPMICRLFSIWRGTADALTEMAASEDFPPTNILIVGDHMPPFTHQASRLQFDAERVPWVLLRYRGEESREAR